MTVAERAKERRKSHTTKNVDGIVMWCDVMCLCCCCCASVFFVIEKNPRKKRNVLFAKMQNMYTRFLFWFITIPVYSCSTFRHQAISHHKWSIIYIYTYIFAVDKVKAAQLKEEKKSLPKPIDDIILFLDPGLLYTPPSPSAKLQALLMIFEMITKNDGLTSFVCSLRMNTTKIIYSRTLEFSTKFYIRTDCLYLHSIFFSCLRFIQFSHSLVYISNV